MSALSLRGGRAGLAHKPEVVIGTVLVIAMISIGLINPAFWQLSNLFGLIRGNLVIGIMAFGVLVVMISGGIDVSFPAFAVAALYLTVKATVALQVGGVVLPFLCATAIGLLLGLVNAFFVYKIRVLPLIVTLGTGTAVRGLLLGGVGASQVNIDNMPPALIDFGKLELFSVSQPDGTHYGLPAVVLTYLALALLVHALLTYTMIGRSVFALGGDAEAAKRAGFDTRWTIVFVYGLAGSLAGFAGLLNSSLVWQANPRDFIGLELDVIAAVVLGGASIFGGRGSVLGTMLGVFILVLINGSLLTMHIPTTWQRVVVGLVIILATAFTAWRERRTKRS